MNGARWIIVGAGAVGGLIGGRLLERTAGEVVLVARGAHAEAIEQRGLTVRGPGGEVTVRPHALWRPEAVGDLTGAMVVLAVKSHQTAAALAQLGSALGLAGAVLCAQNGVGNEDQVAAAFPGPVLGAMVWMPSAHLEAGVVESFGDPDGFLMIGDWRGAAAAGPAQAACSGLAAAGFATEAVADIVAWKRAKLITNLGNALDAFCAGGAGGAPVAEVMAEGRAVLDAAGLVYADPDELIRRGRSIVSAAGAGRREGGSTWQSLARGPRAIEVGALNGYIAELAARVGVPAPLNRALIELAPAFERGERPPRSLTVDELRAAAVR